MKWPHPPEPPGRREAWPPPPRTTPPSCTPYFVRSLGRSLQRLPISPLLSGTGACPISPPLPEHSVNSSLSARPGATAPPVDYNISLSSVHWITPSSFSHQTKSSSDNSTALSPDQLNILHLKHLGPSGISNLWSLFCLSLASADIPSIWKQAIIIALLKASKPASQGTSYCPISLLLPTATVLERLLLPILNEHIHTMPSGHISPPALPSYLLPTP